MFFLPDFFPRLFFFDAVACKFTIGPFPSHAYAKSIYFLLSLSPFRLTPTLGPEFLSKYLLFDDALHIPARKKFPSRPCVPFAESPSLQRERRRRKKYRIYHYDAQIFLHRQTIYPFFAYFFPPLFSLCLSSSKKNFQLFFFSKRMLFHPRIFKIK